VFGRLGRRAVFGPAMPGVAWGQVGAAQQGPAEATHTCSYCGLPVGSATRSGAAQSQSTRPQQSLLRELARVASASAEIGATAFPVEDNLFRWHGHVLGPEGPAGELALPVPVELVFCQSWPFCPPSLRASGSPPPFHPNVDARSGFVCLDLLQEAWSLAAGVPGILLSFRSLLGSPTFDDASRPANVEAATVFLRGRVQFWSMHRRSLVLGADA
jgi:ubiquitin-protein ligase